MLGLYTRSPFRRGTPILVGPVASFAISGTTLTRQFTDQSMAGDASIVSWQWDFGDSNSSNLPSPSHTYGSAGSYIVSLTITDEANNAATTSRTLSVANLPPIDPVEITAMSEIIAAFGRDRTGGQNNSNYYGPVLSDSNGTVQEIINTQASDGRFTAIGNPPSVGAPSIATMTYWHNQIQRCLKKVVSAYRFGTYDVSFQNSATARMAIWRNFKWLVDNVDNFAYGDRGDWTPKGWWGLYITADVLHMMAPAYLSFNQELVDGETVESIIKRLFDIIGGMDNDFNRDGTESWDEENLTGSADNNEGANGLSRATAAFWLALFVARVSGKSEWMVRARNTAISKLSVGYGLTFYEKLGEWQDYVGFHPGARFAAHNSPGAHAHAERYGYTLLRNLSDFLRVTVGTSWAFPPTNFSNIIDLVETISNNKLRTINSKRTQGRRVPLAPPSAALHNVIEDLIDFGDFTPAQVARLQEFEALSREAGRVPAVSHVKWFGTVGILEVIGGGRNGTVPTTEYGYYSHFARARQGNAVAGVACREIQNESSVHFSNGDAIILMGTDLPVSDEDTNFSQFRTYTQGNNSPLSTTPQAVHGVVLMDDPEVTTQSSTPQASAQNEEHSGVADGFRFGVAGNKYHRNDSDFGYFKTRYTQSKVAFTDIQHPDLSPFMAAIFELASDVQTVNSPITRNIVHNVVYTWDRPIVYNFGTETLANPGGSISQSFNDVSFGWIWQATDGTGAYPFGRGTLFLNTKNLIMDCSGVKFRVMIDLTTNPAGASSEFLTVLRCTQADMEELAQNFTDYFSFVNTADLQGATLVGEGVSAFNCWTPNTAFTLQDGNTLSIDQVGSIIAKPEGAGYRVHGAWGLWRDAPAGGNHPVLGTTVTISSLPSAFLEWGKMTFEVDRSGPGMNKPAGEYYGPFGNEVVVSG